MRDNAGVTSPGRQLRLTQSARSKGSRLPRGAVPQGGRHGLLLSGPRPGSNPVRVEFSRVRPMASESEDVSRDAGLDEEIELLEVEVAALKGERDRALSIADSNGRRSVRLSENVDKLTDAAFKAMRLGDDSGARKLLQEKATVSIAQTRADSRAEANVTLAAKLSDILRVRQTKLISLYSNKKRCQEMALGLEASPTASLSPEPLPMSPIHAVNNARHQGRSSRDANLSAPCSLEDSPSWEDDYDDMARSLTEQPFPCEEDLEVAFLALERKTLERMLEISPRGGDIHPWMGRKPR